MTKSDNPISTGDTWVKVQNNTNLPKPNTSIEYSFPGFDDPIIKCHVLSKAGKASTANWHYLNILQNGADTGKCCSFKNVSWRSCPDVDDIPIPSTSDRLPFDTHD